MNKTIEPLLDRVVLLPMKEERTKGGLFLAEDAQDKLLTRARVVAIGPGKLVVHEGKAVSIPLGLKVGDVVFINPFGGMKLDISDGNEYLLMKEDEILGKEVDKVGE
jgi:co-chaperonin GroES (HSP10)